MNKSYSLFVVVALVLGLAIAGCGSSGGSSSSSEAASSETVVSSGGGAYGKGKSAESTETAASSGGETVPISVGTAAGVGKVLVDSNGITLYYFQKDQKGSGESKCSGACVQACRTPFVTGCRTISPSAPLTPT